MEHPISTDPIQPQAHSTRGMISFAISLIMMFAGCLIVTNVLPRLDLFIFVLLIYCILPLLGFVWIGFGFAGLFEKNRKVHFSILGMLFNMVSFLPIGLFWILGLMVGLPFTCFESLANCY